MISVMLPDTLDLLLFRFLSFDTLKSVIHYFQFVNFTHPFLRILFSLPIHPQQTLRIWNTQYKPFGLPTKCSIEHLVEIFSVLYMAA